MNLDFPKYLGIGSLKTLHSFLGIPTALRRTICQETIFDKDVKIDEFVSVGENSAKEGFWGGYFLATLGITSYFLYAVPEAVQK